jgi:FHA domain
MTAAVGQWRVTYAPGDSLVLAGPTSLVLLNEPESADGELINALWDQVIRSESMTEMAGRLAAFSIGKLPGFAAFFWTGSGMRSLVRGDVTVTDPSTGRVVADGSDIQTWSEVGLTELTQVSVTTDQQAESGPGMPLVIGVVRASSVLLDASPVAKVSSPQPVEDQLDLAAPIEMASAPAAAEELWGSNEEGPDTEPMSSEDDIDKPVAVDIEQVSGQDASNDEGPDTEPMSAIDETIEPVAKDTAQVSSEDALNEQDLIESDTALVNDEYGEKPFDPQLFAPQQSPAAQAAMPPPVAADVDMPPTLAATTPPTPELQSTDWSTDSLVLAADCPNGHSNPPAAPTCRMCGVEIPEQDPRLVRRPVLCVLRADDGTRAEVDSAVLIGRAPDPARSNFKAPHLMTLHSPGHDISRTHVEVAPQGWQVVATDLNSTNGTVLIHPDGKKRQQLMPGEQVPVRPGSVLELGDGVSITIAPPA